MRSIAILVLLMLGLYLNGQDKEGAILSLENNSHDFGRIREDKGKISHIFSFSNTGNQPLVLNNVRSACGCTIPKWSKEPVLPGAEGFITIEFNPENRIGLFHKTVQLQSTAINSNMFVTIRGDVLPPVTEEKLEYQIGDLSVKSRHINFGYIYKGKTAIQTLTMANHSDKTLDIDLKNIPEHIVVHVIPSTLPPGEFGQIVFHYNTDLINDWDVVIDRIAVVINGKEVEKDKFAVTANIREDFSDLSEEQLTDAPIAYFDEKNYVFDTISGDNILKYSFTLKNDGKSDLIIRGLKPTCGCTIAKHKRNILSPGASTKIKATFDSEGKSGEFKIAITVITNDPKSYKQYLSTEGYIKR